jgi:hypothetical protein
VRAKWSTQIKWRNLSRDLSVLLLILQKLQCTKTKRMNRNRREGTEQRTNRNRQKETEKWVFQTLLKGERQIRLRERKSWKRWKLRKETEWNLQIWLVELKLRTNNNESPAASLISSQNGNFWNHNTRLNHE